MTPPNSTPTDKEKAVERSVAEALNRHSMENGSNTPDFILAQFLLACLAAWNRGTQQRETWYGRESRPGGSYPTPIPPPKADWCGECGWELPDHDHTCSLPPKAEQEAKRCATCQRDDGECCGGATDEMWCAKRRSDTSRCDRCPACSGAPSPQPEKSEEPCSECAQRGQHKFGCSRRERGAVLPATRTAGSLSATTPLAVVPPAFACPTHGGPTGACARQHAELPTAAATTPKISPDDVRAAVARLQDGAAGLVATAPRREVPHEVWVGTWAETYGIDWAAWGSEADAREALDAMPEEVPGAEPLGIRRFVPAEEAEREKEYWKQLAQARGLANARLEKERDELNIEVTNLTRQAIGDAWKTGKIVRERDRLLAERDALAGQIDAMHRRGLGDVDGPEWRARAEKAEAERDEARKKNEQLLEHVGEARRERDEARAAYETSHRNQLHAEDALRRTEDAEAESAKRAIASWKAEEEDWHKEAAALRKRIADATAKLRDCACAGACCCADEALDILANTNDGGSDE